ncbi:MAG: polysaccharide-degrading enzyme [Opitutaceae bacterium]|nr:polysaccharide-degrading enzyme [Opitutaceae bacterium]
MKTCHRWFLALGLGLLASLTLPATDYRVGPGQPLAEPGLVPWEALGPGDTVFIHWRATPYASKWVLCRQGTAAAPITIRGVRGAGGERPVITGTNATTRAALAYWNANRGLLKIGGASVPEDTMPQHLVVEGLDLRGARPPYSYTGANGAGGSYVNNAAAVYVEKVRHLVVRDCVLSDCGNGLFISPDSQDVLIEGCYIYGNGNAASAYEHNAYTEALGIVYQFNHFGPLRAGCNGNNLKDRSAGLVVRYNWIEGGNRQLDLVDAEGSDVIRSAASYREAFVYGNVLIEPEDGNRQIIHYGGDSGSEEWYRKGTLHLYHNTIVSTRTGRNTLLRLSTDEETCDARNNVVFTTAGSGNLEMIDDTGTLRLAGNWLRAGWVASFNSGHSGTVVDAGSNLTGTEPGFLNLAAQDFHLTEAAQCRNAGVVLAAATFPPTLEYLRHQRSWTRSAADSARDIGAHEFQPYAVWRQQRFGAGADALPAADPLSDPDRDGALNLQEFGHNTDPLLAGSVEAPRPALFLPGDGTSHTELGFARRAGPHGLAYIVQTSPDLVTWTEGWKVTDAGVAPGAVLSDAGSGEQSRVRNPLPLVGREFFRLRLELR